MFAILFHGRLSLIVFSPSHLSVSAFLVTSIFVLFCVIFRARSVCTLTEPTVRRLFAPYTLDVSNIMIEASDDLGLKIGRLYSCVCVAIRR